MHQAIQKRLLVSLLLFWYTVYYGARRDTCAEEGMMQVCAEALVLEQWHIIFAQTRMQDARQHAWGNGSFIACVLPLAPRRLPPESGTPRQWRSPFVTPPSPPAKCRGHRFLLRTVASCSHLFCHSLPAKEKEEVYGIPLIASCQYDRSECLP